MLLAACLAGVHTTSAQVPGRPDPGHLRVYRDWTLFLHPTYGYLLPVPPGVRAIGVPEDAAEAVFVSPDRNFVMRA